MLVSLFVCSQRGKNLSSSFNLTPPPPLPQLSLFCFLCSPLTLSCSGGPRLVVVGESRRQLFEPAETSSPWCWRYLAQVVSLSLRWSRSRSCRFCSSSLRCHLNDIFVVAGWSFCRACRRPIITVTCSLVSIPLAFAPTDTTADSCSS